MKTKLIITGIVSVIVGVLGFWFIPNWPNDTGSYFLTPEESEMAQYRQLVSAGGLSESDEGGYWTGVVMAAKIRSHGCSRPSTFPSSSRSPSKTSFHRSVTSSCQSAECSSTDAPQIVETLGFSKVGTYLIQAPPYAIAYLVTISVSWSSGRLLEHCWHIIACIAVSLAGAVLMISTLNTGARYFAMILLCCGPFVGLNLQISWETTVVPRPRTKRAALVAIANCVSSVSHWFTPYFFSANQAPRYETGGGILIAGCGLTIIFCLVARWWCVRKNKELDQREAETGETTEWRFST